MSNNKIIDKQNKNMLPEQVVSDEIEWQLAVKASKEKYKTSSCRSAHITRENLQYFKDVDYGDEPKGSDFDDYYN
ncbi:MAG: hypothetical protein WBM99_03480 [Psychromonas sp.]